jgi:hypothetical protein
MAKKGISYGPNEALIRGAAAAYRNWDNAPAVYAGLEKAIASGIDVIKTATDARKKVQDKLDLAAEKMLEKSGGLGSEIYNYSVDQVQEWQNQYWEGVKMGGAEGNKIKMDAMNNMTQWGNWAAEAKELNKSMAEEYKNGAWSDGMTDVEKSMVSAVLDEDYTIGKNSEGKMVYNVKVPIYHTEGKYKGKMILDSLSGEPIYEVKQITHDDYKDLVILKNPELGNAFKTISDKLFEQEEFDTDAFSHSIMQNIPTTDKNFRGALHDDVMGQNFVTMLENDTTLLDEFKTEIANADLSDDIDVDNITQKDIINAITDETNPLFDLERSRTIMRDKLTNAAKNDHDRRWAKKRKDQETERNKYNRTSPAEKYQVGSGTYYTKNQIQTKINEINNPNDGDSIDKHDKTGSFIFKNNNWVEQTPIYEKQGNTNVWVGMEDKIVSKEYILKQQGYTSFGGANSGINYGTSDFKGTGKSHLNPVEKKWKNKATGKSWTGFGIPPTKEAEEGLYYKNPTKGNVYLFKDGGYKEVDPITGKIL